MNMIVERTWRTTYLDVLVSRLNGLNGATLEGML